MSDKKTYKNKNFLKSNLDRRSLINPLSLFQFFLMLFVMSCKTRRVRSNIPKDSKSFLDSALNSNQLSSNPSAPNGLSSSQSSNQSSSKSNVQNKNTCKLELLNLEDFAECGENYETIMKVYGDSTSALVVLGMPKFQYESGGLESIFLVRPSGQVIAQRSISENANINKDTTLRPLSFENVSLKSDRELIVLFKTECSNCSSDYEYTKYVLPYELGFESRFLGKPVLSTTPKSIPAIYDGYVAMPIIIPKFNDSGFYISGEKVYAQSDAVFHEETLNGFIITDILGNIISNEGEPFNDFIRYPTFICYKQAGSYYVRTFVKVY